MRWIKLFEDYVMRNKDIDLKDELESFCKDNLAYLLDKGFVFKLHVERTYGFDSDYSLEFLLYKPVNSRSELFEYSDIKYDLIPFLILLNNKYDIEKYYGNSSDKDGYQVKFDNHTTTKPAIYNIESDQNEIGLSDLDDDFNISKIEYIELQIKLN
jgi:hypothetical protein